MKSNWKLGPKFMNYEQLEKWHATQCEWTSTDQIKGCIQFRF